MIETSPQPEDHPHTPGLMGKIGRFFMRMPTAIFVLLLILPLHAIGQFGELRPAGGYAVIGTFFAVLFAAGSLQRMRWRQILLSALAGLAFFGSSLALGQKDLLQNGWLGTVTFIGAAALLVGLVEALCLRQLRLKQAAWLAAAAVLAGMLFSLMAEVLGDLNWQVRLPSRYGHSSHWGLYLISMPAIVLLTWGGVRLGLSAPSWRRAARIRLAAVIVGTGMILVAYVFMQPWLYRWSIQGAWCFDRERSAIKLFHHGQARDLDLLCRQLALEWDSPLMDEKAGIFYWEQDWRLTALDILDYAGNEEHARAIAQLHLRRYRPVFLDRSRGMILRFKQYELAPLLMRTSFFYPGIDWASHSNQTLAELQIPQAALGMIAYCAQSENPKVGQTQREHMTRLLGRDVGPELGPWGELYDEVIATRPTPLDAATAGQINQLILSLGDMNASKRRLRQATREFAIWLVHRDGRDSLLQGNMDSRTVAEENALSSYRRQATEEMRMPEIDETVPTNDDLAREIARYVAAVDAKIAACRENQSGTASAPSD